MTAEVAAHSEASAQRARLAMLDIQQKWGEKHPSYQAAARKYREELTRLNDESIQKSAAISLRRRRSCSASRRS